MAKYLFLVLLTLFLVQTGVADPFCCGLGEDMGVNAAEKLKIASDNVALAVATGIRAITDSVDNGVEIGQEVFRELSNDLIKLLNNFNVRLDSGDMAHFGAEAARVLQLALTELSRNWQIAIKSDDLKLIGAEAFSHLSRALQSLNAKIDIQFNVSVTVDNNTKLTVLYVAVIVAIVLVMCCVISVVCVNGCQKSCTDMFQSLEHVTCNCCIFGTIQNHQTIPEALDLDRPTLTTCDVMYLEGNNDGTNLGSLGELKDRDSWPSAAHRLSIFDGNGYKFTSNSTTETQTFF